MRFKNTKVLKITARGAGSIAAASSYLQVEVNGKRVETKPAAGEYPIWDEVFTFDAPAEVSETTPLTIDVTVRKPIPFFPDMRIGSGTCEVDESEGIFNFKVALTDKNGLLAGSVFLCAELGTRAFQLRSSAGRMLAEVDMPPSPPPEDGQQLSLAISPLTGVLAPEEIDNPNSPYYGILAL